ncbi:hypothetical protein BJF93_10110 [Xaviernesmea oryzae]|uniref:Uncharacterized protein n=1 Tax=Xaviernesmea oryzae TaxID=464029 RepID=A0A1Q9AWY0_9HYPH|nr:hypothetical protein BJF93_10110 [Xaviernesmea oryzae]SEK43980.1 hypothetical protein SAMN04487976_102189 [Xaviernesmea oryzae]
MPYTQADFQRADQAVRRAEERVLRQERLMSRLRSRGVGMREADRLLVQFYEALDIQRRYQNMVKRDLR